MHATSPESGIWRQIFMGGEPVLECPDRQRHAVALLDVLACCFGRVSSVVVGECGDDDADGIARAFRALWGEDARAAVTVPKLDDFVLLFASAFLDDMRASAVDALLLVGADEAGCALMGHGDVIDFVQS